MIFCVHQLVEKAIIVLYSRDHKGVPVGMAHEITSPKNQLQFSQTTMKHYWLGQTKLEEAFRSSRNAFKKLLLEIFFLKLFNGIFY